MKDQPVFEYHSKEAVISFSLPDSSRKSITINPGWSFGTGGHETTRLCINALEEIFKKQNIKNVLDIGCGSGVLSLCAASLGADNVIGIDIDSSIIEEARVNAQNNNLSENINFLNRHLTKIDQRFELVTANILLKTIKTLLPDILDKVEIGGFFIASGIRKEERQAAVDIIEKPGFRLIDQFSEDKWVAVTFSK